MGTPLHKVTFFALDADGGYKWNDDDSAVISHSFETPILAQALAAQRNAILLANSFSAACLSPNVAAFDTLADYLTALNAKSRLSEENPQDGTFISALTEDLPYWAEFGITTPKHLADYLDGCFHREMEKAAYA